MAVRPISKAVLWILGLLGAIYALTAVLARCYFGYMNLSALAEMAIVFLPLAAAGAGAILFVERQAIRARLSRWHPFPGGPRGEFRGGETLRPFREEIPCLH